MPQRRKEPQLSNITNRKSKVELPRALIEEIQVVFTGSPHNKNLPNV